MPLATSSDAASPADIIRLAADRAGRPLEEAVYVGDGVWDLWACRRLGISFIGTGARLARLLAAGAEHICEELEVSAFLEALDRVAATRSAKVQVAPARGPAPRPRLTFISDDSRSHDAN